MYKLVSDSDALIKLVNAGVLLVVAEELEIYISERVYEETVVQGKKYHYRDADIIEEIISGGKIKIKQIKKNKMANMQLRGCTHLGAGEKTTLHLFHQINAEAIVSDDQAFLEVLYSSKIPYLTSSELIAYMARDQKISKNQALAALENIRMSIREANYLKTKKQINEVEEK